MVPILQMGRLKFRESPLVCLVFSYSTKICSRRGSWSEGTKRANDNSCFFLEELVQTDPFQCLTIPLVRKPFQGLISFPLGGFKALSLSGGWKNSCELSTIQAFVSIPPLPTLLQSEGCWLSGPPAVWGVWV